MSVAWSRRVIETYSLSWTSSIGWQPCWRCFPLSYNSPSCSLDTLVPSKNMLGALKTIWSYLIHFLILCDAILPSKSLRMMARSNRLNKFLETNRSKRKLVGLCCFHCVRVRSCFALQALAMSFIYIYICIYITEEPWRTSVIQWDTKSADHRVLECDLYRVPARSKEI